MTPLQAMKQALDALGYGYDAARCTAAFETINKAQTDLRTAIAEMEKAEPVVTLQLKRWGKEKWEVSWTGELLAHCGEFSYEHYKLGDRLKLYTHPQTIPEGWQLVPKQPTPEMTAAALLTFPHSPTKDYQAMLAAAPKLEEI